MLSQQEARTEETRTKILGAAMWAIRTKGFAATTVDDICRHAGVTKGAFFHHFPSKDSMAEAAAGFFGDFANKLFGSAPFQSEHDPFDRLMGYLEFRREILQGSTAEFTCLLGTMVQEVHLSHPEIRDACQQSIWGHVETITPMVAEAKAMYAPTAVWTPESLALHVQAVLQGAFIMAKASQKPETAIESMDHLIRYVEFLFSENQENRS